MSDEPFQVSYDWAVAIEGRIAALEILMVDSFVWDCSQVPSGDVVAGVIAQRQIKLASLQNIERPIGDHADKVWEAAIEALERIYANALSRAKGFYAKD